jgi:hypothetical protein
MMTDSGHSRQFATQLQEFTAQVSVVWEAYQSCGPGNVESALFESVDVMAQVLNSSFENEELIRDVSNFVNMKPDEWWAKIEQLRELCYRCACTPQGLCFITGEAGLIPRKDQHEAFESALHYLAECVLQLEQAC